MKDAALIVGGCPAPGAGSFYVSLIREARLVVAADAGLEVCISAGRMPDLCVGDFDSVSAESLRVAEARGVTVERHPSEKDASDLDLALDAVRRRGATSLVVTAAFSGRISHTLAALGTLSRAADLKATGLDPGLEIHPVDAVERPSVALRLPVGTTFSVMTISGHARVSITGARYPLIDADIEMYSSLGLSNIATAATQVFGVSLGSVLVIVERTT